MSNAAKLKKKAAEFEQKKQFDKALAHYIQLLEELGTDIEDGDVPLYNRVGDLLMRQGTTSEALSYYEKAVDVYAERGFLNNAIALCNKILRQSPARTTVYYKLGKISASKGFKSDAKKNFLEYADRMQKAGQLDEAFRALKEFADLCPDQDDIRLMLAEHLSKENRKDEALEQLQTLYLKFETEGRGAEARATIDRMRAIDPHVTPQQSGSFQAIKSNDLVFLDLNDLESRRTPPAGAAEADAPPEEPAERTRPNVPALDGLTLMFMPDEADAPTAEADTSPDLVEGFAPTMAAESDEIAEMDESDALAVESAQVFTPLDVTIPSLLATNDADAASALPDDADVAPLAGLMDALDGEAEGDDEDGSLGALDAPLSSTAFAELELAPSTDEHPHAVPAHDLALPSMLPMLGADSDGETAAPDLELDVELLDLTPARSPEDEAEIDLLEQMLSPMSRSVPAPDGPELQDLLGGDARELATAGLELIDLGGTPAFGSPWLPLVDLEAPSQPVEALASDSLGAEDAEGESGGRSADPESDADEDATADVFNEAGGPEPTSLHESPDEAHPDEPDVEAMLGIDALAPDGVATSEDDDAHVARRRAESRASAITPVNPVRAYAAREGSVPQVSDEELASVREDGETELQPLLDERLAHSFHGSPVDLPLIGLRTVGDRTVSPSEPEPGDIAPSDVDDVDGEDDGASSRAASAATTSFEATRDAPHIESDDVDSMSGLPDDAERTSAVATAGEGIATPPDADTDSSHDEPGLIVFNDVAPSPDDDTSDGDDSPRSPGTLAELQSGSEGGDDFMAVAPSFGEELIEDPTDFRPHPPLSLDTLEPEGWALSGDRDASPLPDAEKTDDVPSPTATHPTPRSATLAVGRVARLGERIAADPGNWSLHRSLGEALLEIGEREAGLEELDVALTGLEVQGDVDAADSIAEELVRLDPSSVRYHQKRVEYAVRSADRVRLVDAYLELADALFRSGESDKSYVVYARVAELAPQSERARFALGTLVPPPLLAPDTPALGSEELLPDTVSAGPFAVPQAAEEAEAHVIDRVEAPLATRPDDDSISNDLYVEATAATDDPALDEALTTAFDSQGVPDDEARDARLIAIEDASGMEPIGSVRERARDVSSSRATPASPAEFLAAVANTAEYVAAEAAGASAQKKDSEFIDLGDWLREDERPKSTRMVTADAKPSGDEQADFTEMLRKFKQGVAENVDEEDYESHYDLGVAYKEMGLIDEAIAEFQKSLRGQTNRVRSYEALGQCFVEKSQFPVANALLGRAVETSDVDDQRLVGVLYLLAYSCESMGDWSGALRYYQRVFAVDIAFRDVAQRVPAMERKTQ